MALEFILLDFMTRESNPETLNFRVVLVKVLNARLLVHVCSGLQLSGLGGWSGFPGSKYISSCSAPALLKKHSFPHNRNLHITSNTTDSDKYSL